MSLVEAAVFAFFGGTLFLWILPGIFRILAKREFMEAIGVARAPAEHEGYDRKDRLVLFGLVGWLVLFPFALWLMDKGYL